MGNVLIQDKAVAVPGEIIAEGMDFLPASGTFREGEKIVAQRLGLVNVEGRLVRLIPLSGKYLPKTGDVVIGKVIDVTFSGWRMDINCAYSALLGVKDATSAFIVRGADLTKFFTFGDLLVVKIINVTSQNLVDLTLKAPGLRKLGDGRTITVNPNKVPRIIGKQGSMVGLLKDATRCQIVVGQNGLIWISGAPADEAKAVDAIRKIEQESHLSGLTERMKEHLGYTGSGTQEGPQ